MTEPAEDTVDAEVARYDFETIDLKSGSTHADVVLLVGEGKRVLELGPATGYMSRTFADRGCSVVGIEVDAAMARRAAPHLERVIVGDLEQLDLDAELGDDRFDVIVAADVLEHLRDPLATLRRLEPCLAPDGYFVLSIPNVAHGSVRLALLEGRFDYQDLGLLDRTHLTFFTRESLEAMLDEAELGIAVLNRHELNLDASEVPFDPDRVPEELQRQLEADPDSRTYQFVVKAIPMGRDGLREVQRRMREQAVARSDAELRLAHVEAQAKELAVALAQVSGREGELRRALVDAHDQLLRLEELGRGDRAWSAEQAAAIERQQEQIRQLHRELRRMRRTSPLGLYQHVKSRRARRRSA